MSGIGIGVGLVVAGAGAGGASGYSPLTKSLLLDGTDESVLFPDIAACNFTRTATATFAFWFKSTQAIAVYPFSRWEAAPGRGWIFSLTATGALVFLFAGNNTAGDKIRNETAGGYNDGAWHSVAAFLDGSNTLAGVTLYIDGAEATASQTGGIITGFPDSAAANVQAGYGNIPGVYYAGNICHASVHTSDLSARVVELWGQGSPRSLTGTSCVFHSALGDGDAIGAGNVIDLISANNGTTQNCEAGDFVADVPA